MAKLEIDNMEYSSDALAQAAYVSSDSVNLSAFSEGTIKTQGDYSLKGVASTSALDATLTKTFTIPNDLTNVKDLKFNIRSSRTGSNIKLGLYSGTSPTGGTITDDSIDTSTELVAHYKMNDNRASPDVVDSAGSNTGTATANTDTLSVSGKINNALYVNGDSYISLGTSRFLCPSTAHSAFMWVKHAVSVNSPAEYLYSKPTAGGPLLEIGTNGIISFTVFGDTVICTSATAINDDNWHQVGYVYTGSYVTLYIDGIAENSGSASITDNDSEPLIIGRPISSTVPLYGSVDDVRIYNRALSPSDVSALYNSSNGTEDSALNPATVKIHTFTSDGVFSTSKQLSADVLVVAGGGGGGGGDGDNGSGSKGGSGIVILKFPVVPETLISEITPNIITADQWQTIRWNISNIANINKSVIDTLKVTIVNADAENTFYIDNFNVFPQTYDVVGVIE